MHILIVVSWYKSKENSLSGSFFEEQARALIKKGHTVDIIWPIFIPFSSENKNREDVYYNDNGINTYYFHYKAKVPRNRVLNYYLLSRTIFKKMEEVYFKENGIPDVIHAHTVYYAGIVAHYISKKTNIPFVITEHYSSLLMDNKMNKYDLEIAKKVYLSSKANIVVSDGFRIALAKKLSVNSDLFITIPNMVNSIFFKNIREQQKTPVFFTLSFLRKNKNVSLIIKSFKIFLQKYPNAVLKIGGKGKIKSELEKLVNELKIEENVLFLGEMRREEVAEEMSKTSAFLLATKFEPFGVVLIEALATGVPIITTDSIGPRDIVNDINGLMTDSFSEVDFSNKMFFLWENYQNYSSEEIKKDCYNRFSEEVVMTKIEKVYKKIV